MLLERSPATEVRSLDDPYVQQVSPFRGKSQNPSGWSRYGSVIETAASSAQCELQVVQSCWVPGAQGLVPARRFAAGEAVLQANTLLWSTGADVDGVDAQIGKWNGIQILVTMKNKSNSKTLMKAKCKLTDRDLCSRLHFAHGSKPTEEMGGKFQFVDMKVAFPRLGS